MTDPVDEVLRAKVPEGSMLRVTLDDDKTIVRLGSLWDERNTKWVSGNFFNKDLKRGELDLPSNSDDIDTEITTTPSDNIFSDNVNDVRDISEMFKFDASLSMAFMGGTLKITGNGHYDSSSVDNYENTSFVYAWRRTTATERVKQSVLRDSSNFWEKYKLDAEEKNDEPMGTHFVSAIVYGGTLSMTSTTEKSFHGHEQTIAGGLEVSYAALASGKADFTMNSQEAKYYEKVTTTIKGDVNIPDLTEKNNKGETPLSDNGAGNSPTGTGVGDSSGSTTDAAETELPETHLSTEITTLKGKIRDLENDANDLNAISQDEKQQTENRLQALKEEIYAVTSNPIGAQPVPELDSRLKNLKEYKKTVHKQEINYYVNLLLPETINTEDLPNGWEEGKPNEEALRALDDEIQRLEDEIKSPGEIQKTKHENELRNEIQSLEEKLTNLEIYQNIKEEIAKKQAQCDKLEEMRDRLVLERGNKALNALRKSDLDASEAAFQGGLSKTKDAASVKFRQGSWATAAAGLKGAEAALNAYKLMAMAPTLLASAIKKESSPDNKFYGVPLYYVLQPISSVVDKYAIVATKMNEEVAKATTEEYSRFEHDTEKLGWLSRHRALMMAPTQRDEIKQFHSNFHTYMLSQFKKLGKLLPALRAGKDGENGDPNVMDVVTEIRTHSHFSSTAVSKFYEHHHGIIQTYDAWLSQGGLAVRSVKPLVKNYLMENVPGKLDDGGANETTETTGTPDGGAGGVDDDRLMPEERREPLLEQGDQLDFHKSFLPFRPFFETQVLTGVGAFVYNAYVVVARDVRELKRALDNPRVSHSGRSVLLHSVVRPPFDFVSEISNTPGPGEANDDAAHIGEGADIDSSSGRDNSKTPTWPDGTVKQVGQNAGSNDGDALMTLSTSLFARGNRDGGSRETPFIVLCDVTDRSPSADIHVVDNVSRNKSLLTLLDPRRKTGKLVYGENFIPPSAPSRLFVPDAAITEGVEPVGQTTVDIGVEIPYSGSRLGNRFHVHYKEDVQGSSNKRYSYIVCAEHAVDKSEAAAADDNRSENKVYFGRLTGLESNTRYFLRARATVAGPEENDVAGYGPWSNEVTSSEVATAARYEEWLTVATRPMAPTGIVANSLELAKGGSNSVTVEFCVDIKQQERYKEASERIRLLRFEIRSNPDVPESKWEKWNFDEALNEWNSGKDTKKITLSGLCPNCKHDVQARAVSEVVGGVWSEPVGVFTLPQQPKPPQLKEAKANETAIKVAWDEYSGILSYELRWKEQKREKENSWDSAHSVVLPKEEVPDLSYTIEYLASNTLYLVQLRLKNEAGYSKWSNSRYANTFPSQPGSPQLLDKGKEIWVEWNRVDEGSEGVKSYELYFMLPDGKTMPNSIENKINANPSLTSIEDGNRFRYEIKETGDLLGMKIAATVKAVSNATIDGIAIEGRESIPGSLDYKASGVVDTKLQRLTDELEKLRNSFNNISFMELSSDDKYVLKPGAVSSNAITSQAVKEINVADDVWNKIRKFPHEVVDTLHTNDTLLPNQFLQSHNGHFRLVHQYDGNVVLYEGVEKKGETNTSTTERKKRVLTMKSDGNLELHWGEELIWASNTSSIGAIKAKIRDDGKFVFYSKTGVEVYVLREFL